MSYPIQPSRMVTNLTEVKVTVKDKDGNIQSTITPVRLIIDVVPIDPMDTPCTVKVSLEDTRGALYDVDHYNHQVVELGHSLTETRMTIILANVTPYDIPLTLDDIQQQSSV